MSAAALHSLDNDDKYLELRKALLVWLMENVRRKEREREKNRPAPAGQPQASHNGIIIIIIIIILSNSRACSLMDVIDVHERVLCHTAKCDEVREQRKLIGQLTRHL